MSGKRIPWEYCECGCKSYSFSVAGLHFSLYWDLRDGWYLTTPGEGCGKYSTQEAADDVVKHILKQHFEKYKELMK